MRNGSLTLQHGGVCEPDWGRVQSRRGKSTGLRKAWNLIHALSIMCVVFDNCFHSVSSAVILG